MPQYPTGRWIVYREEDYWIATHVAKEGCFAESEVWQELLDKMSEAERVWDETSVRRAS